MCLVSEVFYTKCSGGMYHRYACPFALSRGAPCHIVTRTTHSVEGWCANCYWSQGRVACFSAEIHHAGELEDQHLRPPQPPQQQTNAVESPTNLHPHPDIQPHSRVMGTGAPRIISITGMDDSAHSGITVSGFGRESEQMENGETGGAWLAAGPAGCWDGNAVENGMGVLPQVMRDPLPVIEEKPGEEDRMQQQQQQQRQQQLPNGNSFTAVRVGEIDISIPRRVQGVIAAPGLDGRVPFLLGARDAYLVGREAGRGI